MSYFKSKGIVLKKTKHGEKEYIYSLFSYDFWKIDVLKKISSKEKSLDVWYDINFEIHSKKNSSISKIANIKIVGEFDPQDKDFNTIHDYLALLSQVQKRCEKSLAIYEIYEILHIMLKSEITREKILLAHIKIMQVFWELVEEHSDPTTQKILKFIHQNSASKIMRLTWMQQQQYQHLSNLLQDH